MASWWAEETIASLAALPGFPGATERAARETLAAALEKIFAAGVSVDLALTDRPFEAEQTNFARALLAKMLDYDRWPGPGPFLAVARAIRFPNASDYNSADYPHLSTYLPAPAEQCECARCDGFGYRATNGEYERCACPAGEKLSQPFLDLLNRRTARARGPQPLAKVTPIEVARARITERDIENAAHVRRVERALNDPDFLEVPQS